MTPDEFGGKVPEVFSNKSTKTVPRSLKRAKIVATYCYLLLPIATSFSVAGFPSTIALQRPRLGQSGVLPGAFLDLTYHNGRCHCEYQVASHVIDACDVAILEFVKIL